MSALETIQIPTALTPAEHDRLQELADDKVVLEVGSLLGYSTVALAQVARSVVSVDPHTGYPADDPRPTLAPFLANLGHYRVRELVTVMVGTHDDVFRWLKPDTFDMAFIDCTGEFELTLDVIQKCQRFLRRESVVCVHDCGHPDWPGAMAAVKAYGEPFELVDRLAVITSSGIPERKEKS